MMQRSTAQRLVLRRVLQPYWRLQRSLTLGAQGIIVDPNQRVLLVRHTYKPGWCFPGGGVEKGETVLTALGREMMEECGVVIDGPPELAGIYSNGRAFPNDHVALFIVRQWHQTHVPAPNSEIAAQAFFPANSVIEGCDPATARRLGEVFAGATRDEQW